jgi:hypothetical protein
MLMSESICKACRNLVWVDVNGEVYCAVLQYTGKEKRFCKYYESKELKPSEELVQRLTTKE